MATVKSTQAMSGALKDVGKSMNLVNQQINLPELQEAMKDFARESDRLGITEEMMSDAIDMAVDNEGTMAETDDVVNQVLGEIGIEVTGQLESGPMADLNRPEEVKVNNRVAGLEARFNALN